MISEVYLAKKRANDKIPAPFTMGNPPAPSPSPSPAPAPVASHTVHPYGLSMREIAQATKLKITLEEYARRNEMVKLAFQNCPFHVGEVLEPRTEKNLAEYGKCRIVGVARDYFEYGGIDSDWDNVVRLLTFEPVDPKTDQINRHYHATVNWFRKDDGCAC